MLQKGMCVVPLLLLALSLAGCKRDSGPPTAPGATPAAASGSISPPALEDVIERDPRYLVGISYPPVARDHPGLATLLKAYADAARGELMQAVAGLGSEKPTAPYDLSLGFNQVVATPDIIAIAADGSSYTGGAHGNPLVARFVWLPRQGKRLTASALLPDPRAWQPIADYAREQLQTALVERVDADALTPAERVDLVGSGSRMIEEGTTPDPANFDQFEPVLDAGGRIQALRFVFPPYQVGPYSDGVQSVEVPAAVLLPWVAAEYRPLFRGMAKVDEPAG
jgi:hypothetical protein